MKSFSKIITMFTMMAFLMVTILPSDASAQTVSTIADIQLLGEADLKVAKIGGTCDGIYVEVKKLFDISSDLNLALKYKVYWAKSGNALEGEAAGEGEVTVTESKDSYKINYDPASNPNGPAGEYAFQLFLESKGNEIVSSKKIVAKVKINGDCETEEQDKDNPKNPSEENGNTDNPQAPNENDGKQGEKLPETATSYGNILFASLITLLFGYGILQYQRRIQ